MTPALARNLAVAPVQPQTAALFDIDGTLVDGLSTERMFFRWLLDHQLIGARQLLQFTWFTAANSLRYGRHVLKKNKAYLGGLPIELVALQASEFVHAEVIPRLNPVCLATLAWHQRCGHYTVLLSGTLLPIASELAAALGVDATLGTLCATDGKHYLAQAPLAHPFSHEKLHIWRAYQTQMELHFSRVYAYGDSIHDRHLLNEVSHPYCVKPDLRLRKYAELQHFAMLG